MPRACSSGVTTRTDIPAFLNHTWVDDGHALVAGSLFVALGLVMFAHAGLLTGGVAGLAFLLNDGAVALVSACTKLAPLAVRWVGALVIGAVLALNHRPGRYLGA